MKVKNSNINISETIKKDSLTQDSVNRFANLSTEEIWAILKQDDRDYWQELLELYSE